MFLGGLSNLSEQKARKNQAVNNTAAFKALTITTVFNLIDANHNKSSVKSDALIDARGGGCDGVDGASGGGSGAVESVQLEIVKRKSCDQRVPLVYTADAKEQPGKELILSFFENVSRALTTESALKEIVSDAATKSIPLHVSAMEFQRDLLEYNFGIERDFGCRFLSKVATVFPDEPYVFECSQNFVYSALKSYVLQLKMRAYTTYIGTRLKTTGGIPKGSVLEFFEGCNALMSLDETKAYLRGIHRDGKDIQPVIVDLQRNILTLMGFDATYACSCLDRISQDYVSDGEMMQKMQTFAMCAQTTAKEAMMSDEERLRFYAEIPREMKHFPHMYILHQQQQAMMRHQQQQGQPSRGPLPPGLALLQTEEGREKFAILMEKLHSSKESVEKLNISSWTDEQKRDFFNKFQDQPFIEILHSTGVNAAARINAFVDLSQEDVEATVTMQTILMVDQKAGGSISKSILDAQQKMWQAAAASMKEGDPERAATVAHEEGGKTIEGKVGSVLATLGSITNYGRSLQQQPSAAHQHHQRMSSDGHVHSADCQHAHGGHFSTSDVSTGKVEKMDR